MSLLEDVFLQDEANEAQELERIIEGDEFEERPRSDSDDNSEKEDEAEEDKRRVDPTKAKTQRVIKNPRFVLNPARLTGPRGIHVIPDHFKDFKFKGKGHEREDLDLVLKKLEHWAYRLYPKFQFEDCLKKIETLGKKRPVMVCLTKIRSDQYLSEETVVQNDSSEEEKERDEFDMLLQEQIELTRLNTPGSVRKDLNSLNQDNGSLIMPKATSSPSISEEQRQRMMKNKILAEERRLARLKNQSNINIDNTLGPRSQEHPITSNLSDNNTFDNINNEKSNVNNEESNIYNGEDDINNDKIVQNDTETTTVRPNRLNVIDSSDEDEALIVSESVSVDIHNTAQNNDKSTNKITCSKDVNDKNNFNKSIDNIEAVSTNNAKDGDYDSDKESNSDMEILQNDKNLDKSADTIETNNAKDDKESDAYMEVLQNDENLDISNNGIDENSTCTANSNYSKDKESKQGIETLENNKGLNKPNDIVKVSSNNAENDNDDKTESNFRNNENEINDEEISSSHTLEQTNKEQIQDIQITNKSQVNNDENIDDLMDVDFSDDF